MRWNKSFIIIVLLFVSDYSYSQNNSLNIIIEFKKASSFPESFNTNISSNINDLNGNNQFRVDEDPIRTEFPFPNNQASVKIVYEFEDLPNGYDFYDLELNYSLTQIGKSNTVTLTPFTTNINLASETRRLFSEPIDERTSISKLYTTFQISRYVFTERIKRLNGDWENLHDYDIQSCFVYLKAIHELVTRDHLSIPSNIIEPINWLSHAIDNYPSKVDRAVKLKHAKQLIDFSKNLKSEEFIKLWNFALNEPNYFRKYQLMKSILLDFRALPTANMRETVVRRSHLTEAEIIKSMANTIYNKGEIEFAGYNSEIDWIIEQLNGIMVQISDNDERHKINQDIIVLSSI